MLYRVLTFITVAILFSATFADIMAKKGGLSQLSSVQTFLFMFSSIMAIYAIGMAKVWWNSRQNLSL